MARVSSNVIKDTSKLLLYFGCTNLVRVKEKAREALSKGRDNEEL